MEFGDIIYFLLLIAFMVLGFFNDARKRKKKEEALKKRGASPLPDNYSEEPYGSEEYHGSSGGPYGYPEGDYLPPLSPPLPPIRELQSTLSTSDYMKSGTGAATSYDYDLYDNVRSSLSEASFSHLAGSPYIPDSPSLPDSPDIPVESRGRRTYDGKNRGGVHPLVAELQGEDATNELRKGIIYSELLNRRY